MLNLFQHLVRIRFKFGMTTFVLLFVIALAAYAKGPSISDHFDGKRFFNPEGGRGKNRVAAVLRWGFTRKPPAWHRVEVTPSVPPRSVDDGSIHVTWVGHATLLIQWQGVNVLTDPIWSERASPVRWTGPRRFAEPGIKFEDLPRIHAVVISHNHYDHMDEKTVKRLALEHHAHFFVPLKVGRWYRKRFFSPVIELDWWQSQKFGPFTFSCVPVKHFSGRSPIDMDRTLWCGWAISIQYPPSQPSPSRGEGKEKFPSPSKGEGEGGGGGLQWANGDHRETIFFSGDTGYTKFFKEVGEKLGPIRFAALPIGAYDPRWFMSPVHVDPAEAVQACVDLGAQHCMGMHFNTFRLTDEPQDEPPAKAAEALKAKNLPDDLFWLPRHSESRTF